MKGKRALLFPFFSLNILRVSISCLSIHEIVHVFLGQELRQKCECLYGMEGVIEYVLYTIYDYLYT